jgi:hypothetical protein
MLVLRHNDIASLDSSCPSGRCIPGSSDPSSLNSTRDRALVEGPIAAALGAGAVVAAGLGIYFLVTSSSGRSADAARVSVEPTPGGGAGLALSGRFR